MLDENTSISLQNGSLIILNLIDKLTFMSLSTFKGTHVLALSVSKASLFLPRKKLSSRCD